MLELVLGWLASKGVGLILGALVKAGLDVWQGYQANEAQRERGRQEVIAKENQTAAEVTDAMANVDRPTDDDVADRLRRHEF